MSYPKNPVSLKIWENGVIGDFAKHSDRWNEYDDHIKVIVVIFNAFMAGKGFYVPLDWKFVKAMTWVETGANALNDAWAIRPMQIGNKGDRGMLDLFTSPQGKLVMPPQFVPGVNLQNAGAIGRLNIIAGVAYLLRRLGNFGVTFAPIPTSEQIRLVPIDGPSGIIGNVDERRPGAVMDSMTGSAIPLKTPLARTIHHPAVQHSKPHGSPKVKGYMGIISWKPLTVDFVAKYYNGGGDGNYADKLTFAYKMVKSTS